VAQSTYQLLSGPNGYGSQGCIPTVGRGPDSEGLRPRADPIAPLWAATTAVTPAGKRLPYLAVGPS
jgi:hypothetical protein